MGHISIWRCDRCNANSEAQAGSDMPPGWAELGVEDDSNTFGDAFAADLCPDCVADLQLWLAGALDKG